MNLKFTLALMLSTTLLLGGCFKDEIKDTQEAAADNPAGNQAPTISGTPPASVQAGQAYDFTPTASDPDGDDLSFTISRKPSWATFDGSTGRLSGTPGAGDVGSFTGVGIAVSDGQDSAALPQFDVTVNQVSLGSATLSWLPPTENADGSTLVDLAGYRIYYGTNSGSLGNTVVLNNPGLTRYVIDSLSAGTWYFSMTSVNSIGTESTRSATASKTIT